MSLIKVCVLKRKTHTNISRSTTEYTPCILHSDVSDQVCSLPLVPTRRHCVRHNVPVTVLTSLPFSSFAFLPYTLILPNLQPYCHHQMLRQIFLSWRSLLFHSGCWCKDPRQRLLRIDGSITWIVMLWILHSRHHRHAERARTANERNCRYSPLHLCEGALKYWFVPSL